LFFEAEDADAGDFARGNRFDYRLFIRECGFVARRPALKIHDYPTREQIDC